MGEMATLVQGTPGSRPVTDVTTVPLLRRVVESLATMRPGRYRLAMAALLFGTMAVPAHAATIQITMQDLVFAPAEVSARVGDTIEWINKDVLAHTATARNGDFDVTTPPKKTVTSVLKKAGSVEYYCRFHPNMKAVLAIAP